MIIEDALTKANIPFKHTTQTHPQMNVAQDVFTVPVEFLGYARKVAEEAAAGRLAPFEWIVRVKSRKVRK